MEASKLIKKIHHDELNWDSTVQLGKGSTAVVHKAIWKNDKNENINVAVKVYTSICNKEIEILTDLDHRNVIHIYGRYYRQLADGLVMEFATDGDLFSYLTKLRKENKKSNLPVRLPKSQFLQWCCDATSAVQYLHKKHITHKDIKSVNYLLSDDYENGVNVLKICDFGISKQTVNTESFIASVGGCTRRWASPEVNKDSKMVSQKSDIYSLCVVIWELWTCEEPWKDHLEIDIMNNIIQGVLLEIPLDFPDVLRPMLKRCWRMERELRCDAIEILSYLDSFRSTLSLNDCQLKAGDVEFRTIFKTLKTTTTEDILHEKQKKTLREKITSQSDQQIIDDSVKDLPYIKCSNPTEDAKTQENQVDAAENLIADVTNDDDLNLHRKIPEEEKDDIEISESINHTNVTSFVKDENLKPEIDEDSSMILMPQETFKKLLCPELKIDDNHDDPDGSLKGEGKSLEELKKLYTHVEESYNGLQLIMKDFVEKQRFHTSLNDGERRHLMINTIDVESIISRFHTHFKESRYQISAVCKLITSILDDNLQPILNFAIYSHIQMNMLESVRHQGLDFAETLATADENDSEDEERLSFSNIQSILMKQANWLTKFHDILQSLLDALLVERVEDESVIEDLIRCCDKLNDAIINCDEHQKRILEIIEDHSTSLVPKLRFNDENEEELNTQKSMICEESWVKRRSNITVLDYNKRKREFVEETKCVIIAFVTSVLIVQPKGEYFQVIDCIHKNDITFSQPDYMSVERLGDDTAVLEKLDPDSRIPIHEYELLFEDSNEIREWHKVLEYSEDEKKSQDLEYFTQPETLCKTTNKVPPCEDRNSSTNGESDCEIKILTSIKDLNRKMIQSISKLQELYIDHKILSEIIGKGERRHLYYNVSEVKDVVKSFDNSLESHRQDSCGFLLTELKQRLDADSFQPVMEYIAHICFQENMLKFQREYHTAFSVVLGNLGREASQIKCRVSEKDLQLRLKKPVEWLTDLYKHIKALKVVFNGPADQSLQRHRIYTETIQMLEKLMKRAQDLKNSVQENFNEHITSVLLNLPVPTSSDRDLISRLCKIEDDWLKKQDHMTLFTKRSLRAARRRYNSIHVNVYATRSVIILTSSSKPNTENTKIQHFCKCYDRNYTDIEVIDAKSRESWMPERELLFRLWIYENEKEDFKPIEYVLELDTNSDSIIKQFMSWRSALVVSTGENGKYDEYRRPIHIVSKPFNTDRKNELQLEVNDYVELLEKEEAMNQAWVKGIRLRGRQTGWFPAEKLGRETDSEYRTGQRVKQRFQKERERKKEDSEEKRFTQSYREERPLNKKVDNRRAYSTQKKKTNRFSSLFTKNTNKSKFKTSEETSEKIGMFSKTTRMKSRTVSPEAEQLTTKGSPRQTRVTYGTTLGSPRQTKVTYGTTQEASQQRIMSFGTTQESTRQTRVPYGSTRELPEKPKEASGITETSEITKTYLIEKSSEDPYMKYLRSDNCNLYQELFDSGPSGSDNQIYQYVPLPPDTSDLVSSDHLLYDIPGSVENKTEKKTLVDGYLTPSSFHNSDSDTEDDDYENAADYYLDIV